MDRLVVEDGLPVDSAVFRFPDASRSGAGVIDQIIAGNPDHRDDAIAHRADVAVFQLSVVLGSDVLSEARASGAGQGKENRKDAHDIPL